MIRCPNHPCPYGVAAKKSVCVQAIKEHLENCPHRKEASQ